MTRGSVRFCDCDKCRRTFCFRMGELPQTMAVVWNVAACLMAEPCRRFGGAFCPQHSSGRISETSVNFCKATRCNKADDSYRHTPRRANLKSLSVLSVYVANRWLISLTRGYYTLNTNGCNCAFKLAQADGKFHPWARKEFSCC